MCRSLGQGTCTKVVSSTNPRQNLLSPHPSLPSRVALVGDPSPLLVGIARHVTAIASAITSSLFCPSAPLLASTTIAVALTPGNAGRSAL